MNGNFKYTLTDEQRNKLKRKLSGKNVKGLASRGDVCAILQKSLDDALNGKQIGEKIADTMAECIPAHMRAEPVEPPCFEQRDFDDFTREEIEEIVTQNRLLISRVNRLQYRLDREIAA